MTSSLRSDALLTPVTSPSYPDLSTALTDNYSDSSSGLPGEVSPGTGTVPRSKVATLQHQNEALLAGALAFAVVAALQSQKRHISQVSEKQRLFWLQSDNSYSGDWRDVRMGGGKDVGWWLSRAAQIRPWIIAETANTVSAVFAPHLQRMARFGAAQTLKAFTPQSSWQRAALKPLAVESDQVTQRWAAQYARLLGEGLGDKSADGLLVSLAEVQRSATLDRFAWQVIGSAVGLPHGQSLSVMAVAKNRLAQQFVGRRPMTPKDFAADVGKLLLSQRAKHIVSNESEVAYNFGSQIMLMTAVNRGYLPKDSRKVWLTAVDERVCPVCAPMDSVAVKIDDPFTVRAHSGVLSHDVRIWVPPAHPLCRCRIVPERVIEHGVITRTARFSRDENNRARLRSRLSDLKPDWLAED